MQIINKTRLAKNIGLILIGFSIGILSYEWLNKNNTKPITDSSLTIDRCKDEKGLFLQKGFIDRYKQNVTKLWDASKADNALITTQNKKKKNKQGVSLGWLFKYIGAGKTLEIQPCKGKPMYISSLQLQENPNRFLLLRRPHDELKLVDTLISYKNPIIRGIHLIRSVN